MAKEFGVGLAGLRSAAGDVETMRSRVAGVASGLRADLGVAGPAWGSDALGEHFAYGPHGYVAQADSVLAALDAMAAWLEDHHAMLGGAADRFEHADQA